MTALECRNFSFRYGACRVLEGINFRISCGERLDIVGPNGSGKSTLLKNMLRLADGKKEGEILVRGRPQSAYSQAELARMLAYVPQADGRVPPFSVREFVALSRYPHARGAIGRGDENSACVRRALELAGCAQLAGRRLGTLSGGQRQRAFLAAALAQETEIILLDEPDSFLDPAHAVAMHGLLRKLHEENGLALVMVTHDLNWTLAGDGLALVLREGRQVFFGPAAELAGGRGILEEAFGFRFSYLRHPRTNRPLVVA